MRGEFSTILSSIQEYLFPLFCLTCQKEGVWLCDNCIASQLKTVGVFSCPVCHKVTAQGQCCLDCRDKSNITSHIAIMPYQEHALIAQLLHTLKYQFAESILPVFDHCVQEFVQKNSAWFSGIGMIIPIPLHRRRFAERGFNQAEKLAELLVKHTGILLSTTAVSRCRTTKQQATLGKSEREDNVHEAFFANDSLAGKTVLLVDDVFTTGSTMQSCAAAVRARGAAEVRGWTVARG
jgi:ComF family protein